MRYSNTVPSGLDLRGPLHDGYADILTPQALTFTAKIARKFEPRRRELMALRTKRQHEFDAGKRPDFDGQS